MIKNNKLVINTLVTLFVGIVASIFVFNYTSSNIKKSNNLEFIHLFKQESSLIQRELDLNIEILASLGNLFNSQEDVSREQFKKFVEGSLIKYKSIQALEWIPRVPNKLRQEYEKKATLDLNFEFKIKAKSASGEMVQAVKKNEYFPVYYAEPLFGNLKAMGFDLSSSSTRLASLNQAKNTRKSAATARIKLVQEKGEQYGFLVFLPVWDTKDKEELKGFALGVYRVGDMLDTALSEVKNQSALLDIWLVDTTNVNKAQLLYSNTTNQKIVRTPNFSSILIEGRTWTLYAKPSENFIRKHTNSLPTISFLVSMTIVLLVGYIFSLKELRSKELEVLVKEKTKDLEASYKKIENFNITLKDKVEVAVEENQQKDRLLLEQSKLAAMGEMIGAIAHQWRQPLNALAMRIQFIEDDFEDEIIDKKYIKEHSEESMKLVNFMSKTIDDFRNFFTIDKLKADFNIRKKINETINMLSGQLENYKIEIEMNDKDFKILGYSSEFQQVILNILNNAKDAFVEQGREDGKIKIDISVDGERGIIKIEDNAGGIPSDVIKRIFEPYYTTKEQGKGTGLGLYMSKMIIEDNMKGKISVQNVIKGALFTIEIELING